MRVEKPVFSAKNSLARFTCETESTPVSSKYFINIHIINNLSDNEGDSGVSLRKSARTLFNPLTRR